MPTAASTCRGDSHLGMSGTAVAAKAAATGRASPNDSIAIGMLGGPPGRAMEDCPGSSRTVAPPEVNAMSPRWPILATPVAPSSSDSNARLRGAEPPLGVQHGRVGLNIEVAERGMDVLIQVIAGPHRPLIVLNESVLAPAGEDRDKIPLLRDARGPGRLHTGGRQDHVGVVLQAQHTREIPPLGFGRR